MSIWVRAFCRESVAGVTPEQLRVGIAERLRQMTYLLCPDEEEEPDEVLGRLRIEDCSEGGRFATYLLHYRQGGGPPIRIDRRHGPEIQVAVRESLERLEGSREAGAI